MFRIVTKRLKEYCRIPCEITLYEVGLDEDGAERKREPKEFKCFMEPKHTIYRDDKGAYIGSTVTMWIPCDIAPDLKDNEIKGKVKVRGVTYEISNSERPIDFDSEVVFTKLSLI